MAALAIGNQQSTVLSLTGSGSDCAFPEDTTTGVISSTKVFIGEYGVVVEGDFVGPHSQLGCTPDLSVLTTFSSKVSVNGKGIARIGDKYSDDNIITSGSAKVFCG